MNHIRLTFQTEVRMKSLGFASTSKPQEWLVSSQKQCMEILLNLTQCEIMPALKTNTVAWVCGLVFWFFFYHGTLYLE